MKIKKFWNWKNIKNQGQETEERILELNGTIAEESWFDDDVTPQLFKEELNSGTGNITIWINSPGGDCIAAAQIYNMLSNYKGKITIKIDGIAASAASVIAMAGDKVLVSPVSMLMIHNPATIAWGDHTEMQKVMDMLTEVKESIINAYMLKTGLSRERLSHLMDTETWMNANKAIELGFADAIITREKIESEGEGAKQHITEDSILFSRQRVTNVLLNKLTAKYEKEKPKQDIKEQVQISVPKTRTGRSIDALMERLILLRY